MDIKKEYDLTNPYEIARYIKDAKKTTPVKAYIDGNLNGVNFQNIEIYGEGNFYVVLVKIL